MAPLIAIVGRPNVGKSTLYNRLVKGRSALVHDTPGLTRDRRYGEVAYQDVFFNLVDTGGLDLEADGGVIHAGIHRQAMAALEEADGMLFVLDGRAGVTAIEQDLAGVLRRLGKPVLVIANKIDSPKRDTLLSELYALGLGDVHAISAAHGIGIDEMLDVLETRVPAIKQPRAPEVPLPEGAIRVALIGKPNAGKSSILNRLVGSERSLVHHEPGTTTDPVDTVITMGGQTYVMVDTAGIRRRARVHEDIEKLSVVMAIDQIRRCDVVILVIDAAIGPSEQDARLCGEIAESGRGLVVALNKADLLDGAGGAAAVKRKLSDELYFFEHAPFHLMSAKRGDGTDTLLEVCKRVYDESHKRVPTGELNRFFAEVVESHPPPTFKGKSVSIQYLTQPRVKPPTFLLFANRADGIQPAYRRYVENQLRKRYGYKGVPLRILARGKSKKSPSGSKPEARK